LLEGGTRGWPGTRLSDLVVEGAVELMAEVAGFIHVLLEGRDPAVDLLEEGTECIELGCGEVTHTYGPGVNESTGF